VRLLPLIGSNDPTTNGRDHSLSPPGRSSSLQKGVQPMPHKKERNLAFGPSALNDLAQALVFCRFFDLLFGL
jgi:hypothetical protein